MRASLVVKLGPLATEAHREISGMNETLSLEFAPGNGEDFAADLARIARAGIATAANSGGAASR